MGSVSGLDGTDSGAVDAVGLSVLTGMVAVDLKKTMLRESALVIERKLLTKN
jgi:hypothetical protein